MQKRQLPFRTTIQDRSTLSVSAQATQTSVPTDQLEHFAREWLYDCEYRQHSKGTLANRRLYLDKLIWFHASSGYGQCGVPELRRFFAYLTNGHESENGRWDSSERCHFSNKPLRPTTIATYAPFLIGASGKDSLNRPLWIGFVHHW